MPFKWEILSCSLYSNIPEALWIQENREEKQPFNRQNIQNTAGYIVAFDYSHVFRGVATPAAVAAISRGVGGVLPPTQSPSFTFLSLPPSLTRTAVSLGPRTHGGIWNPRCVRSGPWESVCCAHYWPPWDPVVLRSWWRWCRRRWSPSPPCWSQRLWSPLWLATQRTVCHITWAASRNWTTQRNA